MSLLDDIEEETRTLLDSHGLHDWTVRFNRASNVYGICKYRTKEILLSDVLCLLNSREQTRDTILHEIAHALTPRDSGHGYEWKSVARQIGAKPERCFSAQEVATPKKKYWYGCELCGRHSFCNRKKKLNRSCVPCAKSPFYVEAFKLIYKENK
jgi:predicted SprT family Zn-dependent metalloprotease